MRSRNTKNADERHDQEKSCINDTDHGKSEWYAPKLKRIDINATLGGGTVTDADGATNGS